VVHVDDSAFPAQLNWLEKLLIVSG